MYVSLGTELKVAPKNHTGHDPQIEVTKQVFLNLAIFALGRGKREEKLGHNQPFLWGAPGSVLMCHSWLYSGIHTYVGVVTSKVP